MNRTFLASRVVVDELCITGGVRSYPHTVVVGYESSVWGWWVRCTFQWRVFREIIYLQGSRCRVNAWELHNKGGGGCARETALIQCCSSCSRERRRVVTLPSTTIQQSFFLLCFFTSSMVIFGSPADASADTQSVTRRKLERLGQTCRDFVKFKGRVTLSEVEARENSRFHTW